MPFAPPGAVNRCQLAAGDVGTCYQNDLVAERSWVDIGVKFCHYLDYANATGRRKCW